MDRYKCIWQNEKYNYVKANKFSIPLQESFVHESSIGDKVKYVYWVLSYECVYIYVYASVYSTCGRGREMLSPNLIW